MDDVRQVQARNNIVAVCLRAFGLRYRTELARKLGVTKFAVRNWEHADRLPPAKAIEIAKRAKSEGVVLPQEFYQATGLPNGHDRDVA